MAPELATDRALGSPEIVRIILDTVADTEDSALTLRATCIVNRLWADISTDILWRECTFDQVQSIDSLDRRQYYAGKVHYLTTFSNHNSTEPQLDFGRIQDFSVRFSKLAVWQPPPFLHPGVMTMLLLEVKLTKKCLYLLAKQTPHLEVLVLEGGFDKLQASDLIAFLKYRTKLRSLYLGKGLNSLINGDVLSHLASRRNLVDLHFHQSIGGPVAKYMVASGRSFVDLQDLAITMDSAALEHLAPHMVNLTDLTMGLNDQRPVGLVFLPCLQRLEKLNIVLTHTHTRLAEPELLALQQLPNLVSFNLTSTDSNGIVHVPSWDDDRMVQYLSHFPRLTLFDSSTLEERREMQYQVSLSLCQRENITPHQGRLNGLFKSSCVGRWVRNGEDLGAATWEKVPTPCRFKDMTWITL